MIRMKSRLEMVFDHLFKSTKEAADYLGVKSTQAISQYKSQKNEMSYQQLFLIANKGINLNWLFTGDGEMLTNHREEDSWENRLRRLIHILDKYPDKEIQQTVGFYKLTYFEPIDNIESQQLKASAGIIKPKDDK